MPDRSSGLLHSDVPSMILLLDHISWQHVTGCHEVFRELLLRVSARKAVTFMPLQEVQKKGVLSMCLRALLMPHCTTQDPSVRRCHRKIMSVADFC